MQSVKFEWTPQLEEIFSWGPSAHPYLGPRYARKEALQTERYEPGMALPEPTDYRTFLQWCGLREETIHEVSEKFNTENRALRAPNYGYTTELEPAGFYYIHFPILEGMVFTYFHMLGGVLDFDYEESYEGYIKKAIQRGLRPEFAIFCGLHEDDPRAKRYPRLLKRWFSKSPTHYMIDRVGDYALWLLRLMRDKLVYEGKVVVDNRTRDDLIVSDAHETQTDDESD